MRLKQYRQAAGLSQNELAKRSGVQLSSIGFFETGRRKNPTMETLIRLAKTLGCTIDELVLPEDGFDPKEVVLRDIDRLLKYQDDITTVSIDDATDALNRVRKYILDTNKNWLLLPLTSLKEAISEGETVAS